MGNWIWYIERLGQLLLGIKIKLWRFEVDGYIEL